jgi:hypothetical protein
VRKATTWKIEKVNIKLDFKETVFQSINLLGQWTSKVLIEDKLLLQTVSVWSCCRKEGSVTEEVHSVGRRV